MGTQLKEEPTIKTKKGEKEKHHASADAVELGSKDVLYIVTAGQKVGPAKLHQIQKMLARREVKITDLASADEGNTWFRLFQIKNIDGQAGGRKELPELPDLQTFKESSEKKIPTHAQEEGQTTQQNNAIADLAFLENAITDKVAGEKEDVESDVGEETAPVIPPAAHSKGKEITKVLAAPICAGILAGVIFYMVGDNSPTTDVAANADKNSGQSRAIASTKRKLAPPPRRKAAGKARSYNPPTKIRTRPFPGSERAEPKENPFAAEERALSVELRRRRFLNRKRTLGEHGDNENDYADEDYDEYADTQNKNDDYYEDDEERRPKANKSSKSRRTPPSVESDYYDTEEDSYYDDDDYGTDDYQSPFDRVISI